MTFDAAIIANYDDMSGSYTCNRLCLEAEKRGIRMETVGVLDTVITDDGIMNRGKVIGGYDFVINRYKWGHVKDAIAGSSQRSYNRIDVFNIYVNKYEQYRRIRSGLFDKPRSILSNGSVEFSAIADDLGTPFVAKGLENSQGSEIFLIDCKDDYDKIIAEYGSGKEWLFQEFISASRGRDLRVFSVRGRPIVSMIRENENDFRSNFALGSTLTLFDNDDVIEGITEEIYRQTGIDFVGIDLLFGKEGYCLCEVNVMPGLKGVESVSGVNVAGTIMETIRGDLDG